MYDVILHPSGPNPYDVILWTDEIAMEPFDDTFPSSDGHRRKTNTRNLTTIQHRKRQRFQVETAIMTFMLTRTH